MGKIRYHRDKNCEKHQSAPQKPPATHLRQNGQTSSCHIRQQTRFSTYLHIFSQDKTRLPRQPAPIPQQPAKYPTISGKIPTIFAKTFHNAKHNSPRHQTKLPMTSATHPTAQHKKQQKCRGWHNTQPLQPCLCHHSTNMKYSDIIIKPTWHYQ